jgi:PilZ domain
MSGRVMTHHLLKTSRVLLGTARLAGEYKAVPQSPGWSSMDFSLPCARGTEHPFPNDKRTSPRYPYQRKALCQVCPQEPSSKSQEPNSRNPSEIGSWNLNLGSSSKAGGCHPGSVWFMGTSQDLSASGIAFILHHRFDPGTVITIELERPKLDSWCRLPARVMHATPQADGNWKLGCALVHAMSPEELRGWINGQESKVAAHR